MIEEFNALIQNQTWSLVPPHPTQQPVGCKWIFKIKYKADGSIERRKARLVAKGYHQQFGIDFTETFCPVAKPTTIRVLLSLAAQGDWKVLQLDVSNAFLHGHLEEDVYMIQPPGFQDPLKPNHVCKLHKSLYGLKQTPRAWYSTLSDSLISLGFIMSSTDHSLFTLTSNNSVVYMLVYLDDILLTGNDPSMCQTVLQHLQNNFAVKNLGPIHYFLGLEIQKTSTGYFLHQSKYATDILSKAFMLDCKPCSTPSSTSYKLDGINGEPLSPTEASTYRSIVGALQYLSWTRPDICFSINQVCQYLHSPRSTHFQDVKCILRFIKGTLSHGLAICKGPNTVIAYCDSDWAGSPDDRRSTTGFSVFLGLNLVSWCAKKQPTVARSSTEAEYRALAYTSVEIAWLCQLFKELHLSVTHCPTIWIDNISAMSLASNLVYHARTKHIEVDYHYVRELVTKKFLKLNYIHTKDQVADIFTKSLPSTRFNLLQHKLSVLPLSA
ncbi:hypothetical protein ACHQM5_002793 [Ranunculus cassubicifolius]